MGGGGGGGRERVGRGRDHAPLEAGQGGRARGIERSADGECLERLSRSRKNISTMDRKSAKGLVYD